MTEDSYLCNDGVDVLGADDTTGIWLMLNMIKARIPGTYFFFRGEEVGGIGSTHMFDEHPELYQHLNCMITFDRMDLNHIITHQMSQRCCSDTFTKSLANAINPHMPTHLQYAADSTGSFTDSANFTDHISECTNLSVGYYHQHTTKEIQAAVFALNLRDALLKTDWTTLEYERVPTTIEYDDEWGIYGGYGGYGRNNQRMIDQEVKDYTDTKNIELKYAEIMDLVNIHPDVVMELLLNLRVTNDDVHNAEVCNNYYGSMNQYT